MQVAGLYHVNVNCSDFDRSLAFYEALGFRRAYALGDVAGEALGRLLDLPEPRGRAALLRLGDDPRACHLDLIEWTSPRSDEPPYAALNHLGAARICLHSKDVRADHRALVERGVDVLSEPVALEFANGSRAVAFCFRDPDGTILELIGFDR